MPALAGVIERVKATAGGDPVLIAQPTVASAIAYPVGVLVPMLVILFSRRVLKVDLKAEARGLTTYHTGVSRLDSRARSGSPTRRRPAAPTGTCATGGAAGW